MTPKLIRIVKSQHIHINSGDIKKSKTCRGCIGIDLGSRKMYVIRPKCKNTLGKRCTIAFSEEIKEIKTDILTQKELSCFMKVYMLYNEGGDNDALFI